MVQFCLADNAECAGRNYTQKCPVGIVVAEANLYSEDPFGLKSSVISRRGANNDNPFTTGTGLALTPASQIAKDHGGSVCIEESNIMGTVFTLSLTKNKLFDQSN
jgi:hypothetical protein